MPLRGAAMNATGSGQPQSRMGPAGLTKWQRPTFGMITVLARLGVTGAAAVPGASSVAALPGCGIALWAAASPDMEFVHASPPGLLQPGEKVTLTATAEVVHSHTIPVGAAYVRLSTQARFTRLSMTYNSDAGDLEAGVPARFLRGSVFEDYVVVGDPTTGQVVTLPAGGAAATSSSPWCWPT